MMVVGHWSSDSSVVGVTVVTGCHRLSPVVGYRLLVVGVFHGEWSEEERVDEVLGRSAVRLRE